MRHNRYIAICYTGAVIAVCLFIAGCGSSSNNSTPADISGTWSGTMNMQGNLFAVALILTQSGEAVSGTFSINYGDSTESGSVEGSYSDGSADIVLKYGNYSIAAATLTFGGNKATGQIIVLATDDTGSINLVRE
jgi:hypothetical protein